MILSSFTHTHIPTLKPPMSAEIPALLYIEKAKIEQKKRLQHERMRHKKDLSSLAHTPTHTTHTLKRPTSTENHIVHTHIHTLKHPMVPHPNRELCNVISKKTGLNRFPSRQRTLHCYIEKNKTEPFPIPTENSALSYRKRPD